MGVVKHLKKPTTDTKKFDGSPLQYYRFCRQFECKIVAHCNNDDGHMTILEQVAVGEPNKTVIGLSHLNTSLGYNRSLKEMHDRCVDVEVVVDTYENKALNWSVIKACNVKASHQFALFLQECRNAAQSLEAIKGPGFTKTIPYTS